MGVTHLVCGFFSSGCPFSPYQTFGYGAVCSSFFQSASGVQGRGLTNQTSQMVFIRYSGSKLMSQDQNQWFKFDFKYMAWLQQSDEVSLCLEALQCMVSLKILQSDIIFMTFTLCLHLIFGMVILYSLFQTFLRTFCFSK